MTKESKIRLLVSKSHAYKLGFKKAREEQDVVAADKWKAGYLDIVEKINELKDV